MPVRALRLSVFDNRRDSAFSLKTMNARKGIKTVLCSLFFFLHPSLKTMNARKGIKTVKQFYIEHLACLTLKTMNARKGIKTKFCGTEITQRPIFWLKTMNARKGIKTYLPPINREEALARRLKTMNARKGIKTRHRTFRPAPAG